MNNNNFVVAIPKELKKIKSKLFLGLTQRQLIGFGVAIVISGIMFLLTKSTLGVDTAMYVMFIFAAPIFFITIYSKDGIPAEHWIKLILEYKYLHPHKRRYRITKTNKELANGRGIRFGKRKQNTKTNEHHASITKND